MTKCKDIKCLLYQTRTALENTDNTIHEGNMLLSESEKVLRPFDLRLALYLKKTLSDYEKLKTEFSKIHSELYTLKQETCK